MSQILLVWVQFSLALCLRGRVGIVRGSPYGSWCIGYKGQRGPSGPVPFTDQGAVCGDPGCGSDPGCRIRTQGAVQGEFGPRVP